MKYERAPVYDMTPTDAYAIKEETNKSKSSWCVLWSILAVLSFPSLCMRHVFPVVIEEDSNSKGSLQIGLVGGFVL